MLKTAIEVPEQPYHLSWDITSACNLKCSFCYSSKHKNQVESKDLIDLILDQIVELAPLHLGIGGGEPTESEYLMYVLEFIFKTMGNKMPVISIDNMQLSKHPDLLVSARRFNEALQDNKIGFYLSIHGIDRIHDLIVGKEGHFIEQMRAIQFLKEAGVPFAIGVVPTKQNFDQLDDILNLALGLGSGLLNISQFVEIGRGETKHDLNLTIGQYEHLLKWIITTNRRLGRHFIVTHEHWLAAFDKEMYKNEMFIGCSAGIYYLGIRSNGDIVPCQLNSHVLGNVKTTTLKNVWNSSPDLKRWRICDVGEPCGSCFLLAKCGGCRCNAVAAGNGFFGAEPVCPVINSKLKFVNLNNSCKNINGIHKNSTKKGRISAIRLRMYLATKKGNSIYLRVDERNSFIELTECAKNIYLLFNDEKVIHIENIVSQLSNQYNSSEIINEIELLEDLGIIVCDRE